MPAKEPKPAHSCVSPDESSFCGDRGKIKFITLRDWTGDIQIMIGKAQVGEDNFELTRNFDLGDWIAVEGRLGRTNTGELTVFAERLHYMCKALEPPPEKARRIARCRIEAAAALPGPDV